MRRYLLAFLLFGCTTRHPEAPRTPPAPSLAAVRPTPQEAAPAPDHRLGGGYRDAKWGMTRKQVRAVIKGKVTGQEKDTIEIDLRDGGKSVACDFFRDRLYRVTYHPNFGSDDRDRPALETALVEKYGQYANIEGMVNSFFQWPVRVLRWSDDDTQIDLRTMISQRPGFANSTTVVYESIPIAKEILTEQMSAAAEEEARRRQAARKDVGQHL